MANPSLSEVISARADLYHSIRQYFQQQNVLEVDVPLLASRATTDPQLKSFELQSQSIEGDYYLQTSPEFFLKRLLSDLPASVFTITKAFRDEEHGKNHNPEFSMLEWYRVGYDLNAIIEDTLALVLACLGQNVSADCPIHFETYESLFQKHLQIDPHHTSLAELQPLVLANTSYPDNSVSVDEALQLLLTAVIEPRFDSGITVLSEFPISQAALSEIGLGKEGYMVAKRFEVYLGQTELANGYQELIDAKEQEQRFIQDNEKRTQLGKPIIRHDEKLLAAMEGGLPQCAGVSIGLDRLLMAKLGTTDIEAVLLFPWDRV